MPAPSIDETLALLESGGYVADRALATVLFLALTMNKPLFLEGEAGVGKTEVAKVLSGGLNRHLIRLQCYEGLDIAHAVYDWNYAAQMIEIRLAEAGGLQDRAALRQDIFNRDFLIPRPLLQALEAGGGQDDGQNPLDPPVLLIDELDRADEPFEAYLLEFLADFSITIPEIGIMKASRPPIVVITSNRTREIHDAIKRRCLYHWIDYPDAARERAILARKAPGAPAALTAQITAFVQELRQDDLFKKPGIAESIDWANALTRLDVTELSPPVVEQTLGVLLKYQDDLMYVRNNGAERILTNMASS